MHTGLIIGILGITSLASQDGKNYWNLKIGKRSQTTQIADVTLVNGTHLGLGLTRLMLGCSDGRPFFQIAEDFTTANSVAGAISEPRSKTESGDPLIEPKGFVFSEEGGKYQAAIQFRIEGETKASSLTVPAAYDRGTYFLILDGLISRIVPNLEDSGKLYFALPYKDGVKDRVYQLGGTAKAIKAAKERGCILK